VAVFSDLANSFDRHLNRIPAAKLLPMVQVDTARSSGQEANNGLDAD
jgi:hypothetical protein